MPRRSRERAAPTRVLSERDVGRDAVVVRELEVLVREVRLIGADLCGLEPVLEDLLQQGPEVCGVRAVLVANDDGKDGVRVHTDNAMRLEPGVVPLRGIVVLAVAPEGVRCKSRGIDGNHHLRFAERDNGTLQESFEDGCGILTIEEPADGAVARNTLDDALLLEVEEERFGAASVPLRGHLENRTGEEIMGAQTGPANELCGFLDVLHQVFQEPGKEDYAILAGLVVRGPVLDVYLLSFHIIYLIIIYQR